MRELINTVLDVRSRKYLFPLMTIPRVLGYLNSESGCEVELEKITSEVLWAKKASAILRIAAAEA